MTAAEIETLRAAARRDDPIAVMDAIDRVHASYERDRIGYRRFDTMASLLDQTADEGDDAARNYRETVIELEQRRIELDRTALAYVQGENPAETLVASVDAVDEAYRRCERRIETLETTVSDVSVPPLLIVSGNPGVEVPKGTTVSRELTLFNVGRSHTGSIAVDAESEVRTSATPSSLPVSTRVGRSRSTSPYRRPSLASSTCSSRRPERRLPIGSVSPSSFSHRASTSSERVGSPNHSKRRWIRRRRDGVGRAGCGTRPEPFGDGWNRSRRTSRGSAHRTARSILS
jgi:hypothetical protein